MTRDYPQTDDLITITDACNEVGGTRPISKPTFYRDPELKALIVHPTPGISRVRRSKLRAVLAARMGA